MRDDQMPESVPAAARTPAGRGRYRNGTLAAALFLALAVTVAWAPASPASAGPVTRLAHGSRVASTTPSLLRSRDRQRAVRLPPAMLVGNGREGLARLGRTAQGIRGRSGGSLQLDGSPGFPPVANPRTGTLYVPIQCRDGAACAGTAEHVVDVIDAAKCNAKVTSGCRVIARAQATNTVYAANSGTGGTGDTVSVFDGATCNGSTGTGCGRAPHNITVGTNPFWDVVDQATDTIYVANFYDGHSKRDRLGHQRRHMQRRGHIWMW